MTIVLAQTNVASTCLIQSHLLEDGCQVVTCGNDDKTLLKVSKIHPDVVIVDLSAATLSLIKEMRQQECNRNIPILVLSNLGQERLVEQAFELGASDYVSHPYKRKEFSIRINLLAKAHKSAVA